MQMWTVANAFFDLPLEKKKNLRVNLLPTCGKFAGYSVQGIIIVIVTIIIILFFYYYYFFFLELTSLLTVKKSRHVKPRATRRVG
jgi:hypothetical protein